MTLIHHGQLIDGTGKPPIPNGAVLIHDGRITYAGPENKLLPQSSEVQHIDARGGTIMPGLVEAHFHPTYFNVAALEDLDIKYPVEYVTLLAACNAKLVLECGYTAGAAAAVCLISIFGSRRLLRTISFWGRALPPVVERFAASAV